MEYLTQGFVLGLAYVAPIGLQNLFVINFALTQSRVRSLITALIVIFFDVTLALGCFFGIGLVLDRYEMVQKIILGLGSLIVLYIGISLIRAKGEEIEVKEERISIGKTAGKACVVTWFNPQAIIDGTLMLGAFRTTLPSTASTEFILGVAAASCTWFIGLTLLVGSFSFLRSAKATRIINLVCGVAITGYGLKLLWSFIQMLI